MITRALLASAVLVLASATSARADECPASKVDIGDWPIVRSARVPGFTLRLPRSFARDSSQGSRAAGPSAGWSDTAGARFTMTHRSTDAMPAASLPPSEGASPSTSCETRVGAATATIVAYGAGPSDYVIHARIRWPDGESVDVRADAANPTHLDLLLAAVRTIRRAGA